MCVYACICLIFISIYIHFPFSWKCMYLEFICLSVFGRLPLSLRKGGVLLSMPAALCTRQNIPVRFGISFTRYPCVFFPCFLCVIGFIADLRLWRRGFQFFFAATVFDALLRRYTFIMKRMRVRCACWKHRGSVVVLW